MGLTARLGLAGLHERWSGIGAAGGAGGESDGLGRSQSVAGRVFDAGAHGESICGRTREGSGSVVKAEARGTRASSAVGHYVEVVGAVVGGISGGLREDNVSERKDGGGFGDEAVCGRSNLAHLATCGNARVSRSVIQECGVLGGVG